MADDREPETWKRGMLPREEVTYVLIHEFSQLADGRRRHLVGDLPRSAGDEIAVYEIDAPGGRRTGRSAVLCVECVDNVRGLCIFGFRIVRIVP